MALADEKRNIELTTIQRAYIKAALDLKKKSMERALKTEANPEIVRARSEEIKTIQDCINKM